ncbi:MAG: FAD-dependent monooxygenase [Saprospiraceae bacterium]|nr:FAD-dependent monooxygenase [Saprospiraceae bacterium]
MATAQYIKKDGIIIIGAGLCGSLLGIRLAQRGYEVHIYESRPDMRKAKIDGGRSINLALSDRGIKALELIGMQHVVERDGIPLYGRMIHPAEGEATYMPYSGRSGEAIHSISRGGLNKSLLEETEKYPNIHLYFNQRCVDVNFDEHNIRFENGKGGEQYTLECERILATDGAGSAVRRAMMRHTTEKRFNFSQDFLTHGYKELSIPAADEKGNFRIEKNALHIWPRGTQMLIALPNLGGSFTVTLFQDFEGPDGFNALNTPEKIHSFFDKYYPSAKANMPDLVNDFLTNPSANLGTIKCYPWQINHFSLLMGDAAHAIVPFYGQGMNCAFEDVCVLDDLMDQNGDNWVEIFDRFQENRKPDGDAIADLAVDNFYEMRTSTTSLLFQRKKALETKMEQAGLPYFSKYALVTFRPDLKYREALVRGRLQDDFLLEYCKTVTDINQVDYVQLQADVEAYIKTALQKSEIY